MRCVRFALLGLVACVLAWSGSLAVEAVAQGICGTKRVCADMRTCAEAVHHMTVCGQRQLDRDGDGIPCEVVCGKTLDAMRARVTAQPFAPPAALAAGSTSGPISGLQPAATATLERTPAASPVDLSVFKCGEKRTCSEMTSCEEARFHHSQCGLKRLDGTGNGVPCKALCAR